MMALTLAYKILKKHLVDGELVPGKEIIEAEDFVAARQQALAQMRAEETATTSDQCDFAHR